jgi:hypothetical protein
MTRKSKWGFRLAAAVRAISGRFDLYGFALTLL